MAPIVIPNLGDGSLIFSTRGRDTALVSITRGGQRSFVTVARLGKVDLVIIAHNSDGTGIGIPTLRIITVDIVDSMGDTVTTTDLAH